MKKRNKVVEERLLEVYKTENPSACEIENPNIADQHMLRHQRIYRTLLNFPEKMFQDASLLDVGAGTGEKAIHYTLMGANCDLVEFNDEACQRATHLFDKFSIDSSKFRVFNSSLFDMDANCDLRDKYDIVSSLGVIHHTDDKEKAFRILANKVDKSGFLIISVGNAVAGVQLHLMKWICRNYASSEEEMIKVAETLFTNFIDRASYFGMRSRKAVIYDQIINDQHDYFFSDDLYKLAHENGLTPYSSYPKYFLPVGDSASNPTISHDALQDSLIISDIIYGMHSEDDNDTLLKNKVNKSVSEFLKKIVDIVGGNMINKDLDSEGLSFYINELFNAKDEINFGYDYNKKFNKFISEIHLISNSLGNVDIDEMKKIILDLDVVFKGTEGLGIQYHIFSKDI